MGLTAKGINPVGSLCGGAPWEGCHQRLFIELSKPQKRNPPTPSPASMKRDSIDLQDVFTSILHLQAPWRPFSAAHSEGKTNSALE